MPNPNDYESKDEWLEACIPTRIEEGDEQDQAVAACSSMWDEQKSADPETMVILGGAVKALGNGRVGGYLVRFTSEEEPDIQWDYFDGLTEYGEAEKSPVYYNHGLDPLLGLRQLGTGTLERKDAGVWIEAQLQLRDEYEKAVYKLAEDRKLGWSSGTAPHLVEREEKGTAWHVTRWPLGLDASLTPTPADPGNRAMPLKAWAESVKGVHLQAESEATVGETDAATTTEQAGDVTVHVTVEKRALETPTSMEVQAMDKNKETPTAEAVDVAAIAKEAAEEAVKAYHAAMEKEQPKQKPTNSPGILTVKSEADRALEGNPYKGLGEFLMSVKEAGLGTVDKRLLPLRGEEADLEGAFSLTRALGTKAVGNLSTAYATRQAAIKQTGLGESAGAIGGFLVDTDHDMSIMARVYNVGELLRRVSMFPVSAGSNAMTFNADAETSRVDGSRRGGVLGYWAAEAGTKTASYPQFRQIELKLKKVVALVYATDELLADTTTLEAYILRILPEELSFLVEDAIINGTGVGMPLGIIPSGAEVSVAKETGQAADTIVFENIAKMWSRMWGPSRRNGVWLINQDCEPQLFGLALDVGTGGMPAYLPPGGLSASPYGTLMGRPVIPCEHCQTVGTVGDIILADLSEYYMIEKGGIESASSIHVRFVYDETAFRFVYRVDGEPFWNSPLTPYLGTNTLSPFVTLASRD